MQMRNKIGVLFLTACFVAVAVFAQEVEESDELTDIARKGRARVGRDGRSPFTPLLGLRNQRLGGLPRSRRVKLLPRSGISVFGTQLKEEVRHA